LLNIQCYFNTYSNFYQSI